MRDVVLVVHLVLLLVIPVSTGSEEEHLSPPQKPGFFDFIKDIISNPGKYFDYIKLFIKIFLDYLRRIGGLAHEQKNKIISRFHRKEYNQEKYGNGEGKIDPEVERQINAIIESITAHLADVLPTEAQLPDKDYDFKALFACATAGKLYNLNKIKRRSTVLVPQKTKDSIDIHLSFFIEDINVKYDKLVTRTSALRVRRGDLALEFEENEINVHLSIPFISTVLERMLNMQCVINVESVRLDKLDHEHVHLRTNGLFRGHISKLFIKGGMHVMMSSVLQNVNDSIYEKIMGNLDTSGWWICRQKRTQPKAPDAPRSKYFQRYCMEED